MTDIMSGGHARKSFRNLVAKLEKRRGLLVAFEGPDGSGKTTQRRLFRAWLQEEGHEVVASRWNSSELIKPLVKARKMVHALSPTEFSLLHACDYRHRLETEILPALCAGRMVIADRYLFTALARDTVRGLDLDWVLKLYTPILWPDIVFYFSVSPETSRRRVTADRIPSFYQSGQDLTDIQDPQASYKKFISRVIQEYSALALIFEFVTIDAELSVYDQHMALRQRLQQGRRRSWLEYNVEAVADWLISRREVRLG